MRVVKENSSSKMDDAKTISSENWVDGLWSSA